MTSSDEIRTEPQSNRTVHIIPGRAIRAQDKVDLLFLEGDHLDALLEKPELLFDEMWRVVECAAPPGDFASACAHAPPDDRTIMVSVMAGWTLIRLPGDALILGTAIPHRTAKRFACRAFYIHCSGWGPAQYWLVAATGETVRGIQPHRYDDDGRESVTYGTPWPWEASLKDFGHTDSGFALFHAWGGPDCAGDQGKAQALERVATLSFDPVLTSFWDEGELQALGRQMAAVQQTGPVKSG